MSGQENSLVYADRGNGVVPGSSASLQETVSIITQCHRLIGASGVFRPVYRKETNTSKVSSTRRSNPSKEVWWTLVRWDEFYHKRFEKG
jgi:hypothetical protein